MNNTFILNNKEKTIEPLKLCTMQDIIDFMIDNHLDLKVWKLKGNNIITKNYDKRQAVIPGFPEPVPPVYVTTISSS